MLQAQYEHHKTVKAAQGVKVIGKDLEKALAGLPLYVAHDDDEIEYYKVGNICYPTFCCHDLSVHDYQS